MNHQYVRLCDNRIMTEKLFADTIIRFLYSEERETENFFIKAFSGKIFNDLLGFLNFDIPFISSLLNKDFLEKNGLNSDEAVHSIDFYNTPRKIFERQIRYWKFRPMCESMDAIVSPADSKIITGSLLETHLLYIKNKFFKLDELIEKTEYIEKFFDGDFAIFRLTPDKYHYNHVPVSGRVIDFYEIDGRYYSCNPAAVSKIIIPYSKNRRIVTIIDTDVENGSQIGIIAFIEIVALMIGDIEQYYCEQYYDNPSQIEIGMHLTKGSVKSRFRPGSSTDIILFQKNKINFCEKIIENNSNRMVESRYSKAFNQNLVETEINVRTTIAFRKKI